MDGGDDDGRDEVVDDDDRGFFPGQPFQKNEFDPKSNGDPKAVCTPSIKGSAPSRYGGGSGVVGWMLLCEIGVNSLSLLLWS